MGQNTINHRQNKSVNTSRKPSPAIWGDCPVDDILDPRSLVDGVYLFDDFESFPVPGTQTTEIALSKYKVYNTGAGKVISDSSIGGTRTKGGWISMLADTDGDASAIGTQACPFSLITTGRGKFWFEARIAFTAILTDGNQIFIGMGENELVTFGAATPLANANACSTGDAKIGWQRTEDGLGVLNTAYADRAASWTNIGAAAGTLAALTVTKLGFTVDPNDPDPSRCVRFYQDNVECATAMTKAALLALTYLDVGMLGPVAGIFADSAGTANYLYIDWWAAAQTF